MSESPREETPPSRASSKILGTNFRKVPDCGDFKIELSEFSPMAFELGFKKKLPPKIEITP
jgi:hypothetical protein